MTMSVLLLVEAWLAALGLWLVMIRASGAALAVGTLVPLVLVALAGSVNTAALFRRWRGRQTMSSGSVPLACVVAALTFMALGTLYQTCCYLQIPADILSFAESSYVADIIKLRQGEPVFTPPADNNSYPYSPGSQMLTYGVARILGHGDSIPWYRYVQFSYVVLGGIAAAGATDCLARRFVAPSELSNRGLWWAVWVPGLFLLGTDPRFNLYTHSLHNDGLALLVSCVAYWLLAAYSLRPRTWLLVAMALLPAAGFMVKQSHLLWGGVFVVYFLISGQLRWRDVLLFAMGAALAWFVVVGLCYRAWGEPYTLWVFDLLGGKRVALTRSARNLMSCGIYANLGLLAGWWLVLRERVDRKALALWLAWLLPFLLTALTSGLGYVTNHLGPSVVLAGCWASAALITVWPRFVHGRSLWIHTARASIAVATVVLAFGGLGFLREPIDPVPVDIARYIKEIEQEFADLPTKDVLLDAGSWVYLRDNVTMKDRSAPVSVHVGDNQPEIGRAYLVDTIERFRKHAYRRVLARQIDTPLSWYDYNDRGSGVKQALLENYHEVRRIPGVDVEEWWPRHLLAEVVVLEPNASPDARPVTTPAP